MLSICVPCDRMGAAKVAYAIMSSPTPAETSAGVAVGLHRRIPMRISRPPAIHKKPQSPHFAGHALQPMPGCFPHASDSHTGNIPIPPQSDHVPAETSAAGLRKPGANRSPQTPCGCDDVQPADGVNA